MRAKYNLKRARKIIASLAALIGGVVIGGNVIYNDGRYAGARRVYEMGSEIYDDFNERVQEYIEKDETKAPDLEIRDF